MLDAALLVALNGYAMYMLTGLVMLLGFAFVYLKVTPMNELALIRQGYVAPALSFGGALIGFCLVMFSSAWHLNQWAYFVLWAVLAGLVQIGVYFSASRILACGHHAHENIAVGAFLGCVSIAVGLLNAGCLS